MARKKKIRTEAAEKEYSGIKEMRMLSHGIKDIGKDDLVRDFDGLFLINKFKNLVRQLAWKLIKMGVKRDFDDLVQLGFVGLFTAVERYRDDMDAEFSTYAFNWIFGMMRRRKSPEDEMESLDEIQPDEWGDGLPLIERIPSNIPGADELVERKEMWKVVATLPERMRTIIRLRYAEGMTQDEVGAVLGITKQGVSATELRAKDILRAKLSNIFGRLDKAA